MTVLFAALLVALAICALSNSTRMRRRFEAVRRRSINPAEIMNASAPPRFSLARALIFGVLLVGGGVLVLRLESGALGMLALAAAFTGFIGFYLNLEGDLFMRSNAVVSYGTRGTLWVALIILVGIYGHGDYRAMQLEKIRIAKEKAEREAQREFAERMRSLLHNWKPTVPESEGKQGDLIAFLIHSQTILVDWEFERQAENHDKTKRTIPIDVVVLNNSFVDLPLKSDAHDLWRLTIANSKGRVVRSFSVPIGLNQALFPAETINTPFDWDGRDESGKLVPPDTYVITCVIAGPRNGEDLVLSRRFEVSDAGPIVTVIEDPNLSVLKNQRELDRMNSTFNEMNRSLMQMQQFQLQMNQMQWNMNRKGPLLYP